MPRTGDRSVRLVSIGTSGVTFSAVQRIGEPVDDTNLIRVRCFYKVHQVPSVGGFEIELDFGNSTGATGIDTISVPFDSSVGAGSWAEIDVMVEPTLAPC